MPQLTPTVPQSPSVFSRLLTTDAQEKIAVTTPAVIAAGTATIFTVTGGPIEVLDLFSICITANNTTATLLKYNVNATAGGSTDVCAASATLASAAAGTSVLVDGVFADAAVITAGGTVAAGTADFIVPAGAIRTITTGGATTGTWQHFIRYKPLASGVTVA